MNAFLAGAASRLNPLVAIVITAAGALVGGQLAEDAPLGMILGMVAGSAIAIALCGAVAKLDWLEELARGPSQANPVPIETPVTSAAAAPVETAASTASAPTASAAASAPDNAPAVPLELSQLLDQGQFATYHLERARNFMALGNYKEALQQLGASLSHDPHSAEARDLRRQVKKLRRQK